MTGYDRLTPLEHGMLQLEEQNASLHLTTLQLFEAASLRTDDGGVDVERIRELVRSRLVELPRYRRVLARLPLEPQPIWVDAEEVDLEFHVRHQRLPRPGTERQLKRMVGELAATALDAGRPLWELWVIEGVPGDRIALVTKVHACLIQANGRPAMPDALLGEAPEAKVQAVGAWHPRPRPSRAELALDELFTLVHWPADLWQRARQLAGEVTEGPGVLGRLRALAEALGDGLHASAETPLDVRLGPLRRMDWAHTEPETLGRIVRGSAATLEEIALCSSAGALGRFLSGTRGIDPRALELRALVPVDPVAHEREPGPGAWIVDLPLAERDPLRRLRRIRRQLRREEASGEVLGTGWLAELGARMPEPLLGLATRWLRARHPFHLVITPLRASDGARYLLDARLLETVLLEPLTHGMGLGISITHGAAGLVWGLHADWDAFPDLHELALAIEQETADLARLALSAVETGEGG